MKTYKTPKGVLRAVQRFFTDKKKWCTLTYAKDAAGEDCDISDARACQYCALGAIYKFGGGFLTSASTDAIMKLAAVLDPTKVHDEWNAETVVHKANDRRGGYSRIMKALDKALAA